MYCFGAGFGDGFVGGAGFGGGFTSGVVGFGAVVLSPPLAAIFSAIATSTAPTATIAATLIQLRGSVGGEPSETGCDGGEITVAS